jgi:hypothetical protein
MQKKLMAVLYGICNMIFYVVRVDFYLQEKIDVSASEICSTARNCPFGKYVYTKIEDICSFLLVIFFALSREVLHKFTNLLQPLFSTSILTYHS